MVRRTCGPIASFLPIVSTRINVFLFSSAGKLGKQASVQW